ncbi:hypothetical protein HK100_012513 [Physocladia obscura]|uniref:Uncharacterized protein n=1 Tax=Physocladia obscura TaxID=109957 RepID=A0AAD5T141_9FUNG|nr:hypothetical protein HK100_012513 [Physocladia obscura]
MGLTQQERHIDSTNTTHNLLFSNIPTSTQIDSRTAVNYQTSNSIAANSLQQEIDHLNTDQLHNRIRELEAENEKMKSANSVHLGEYYHLKATKVQAEDELRAVKDSLINQQAIFDKERETMRVQFTNEMERIKTELSFKNHELDNANQLNKKALKASKLPNTLQSHDIFAQSNQISQMRSKQLVQAKKLYVP